MEQFAYFVGRLKSLRDGEGSLLDHAMAVYGKLEHLTGLSP